LTNELEDSMRDFVQDARRDQQQAARRRFDSRAGPHQGNREALKQA
jgi:hypothetical protein